MTRRDYVLIAGVLNGLCQDAAHCFDNRQDQKAIAARFAAALRESSPNFDTARFMEAAVPNY